MWRMKREVKWENFLHMCVCIHVRIYIRFWCVLYSARHVCFVTQVLRTEDSLVLPLGACCGFLVNLAVVLSRSRGARAMLAKWLPSNTSSSSCEDPFF